MEPETSSDDLASTCRSTGFVVSCSKESVSRFRDPVEDESLNPLLVELL